jgi:type IV pilus assembly protein PilN
MKIPINIASQPFRRDRPMVAAYIAISALLAIMLAALVIFIQQNGQQLVGMHQDIARLNRQIHTVSIERTRLDGIMRQPQNSSVLEWSVLINTMIYQKAISWSLLFADLEKTLPYDVKVVALHPQVDTLNHVKLDITLGADKLGSIVLAVLALEHSPAFGAVKPGSTFPPTQAEPLYRYRFTVNYAQKL